VSTAIPRIAYWPLSEGSKDNNELTTFFVRRMYVPTYLVPMAVSQGRANSRGVIQHNFTRLHSPCTEYRPSLHWAQTIAVLFQKSAREIHVGTVVVPLDMNKTRAVPSVHGPHR
jgi:hypothetical protein